MKSMKLKKKVLIILTVLVVPVLLSFYQLGMFNFFAPKFRNVERKVFKQTRSYNEGKIQQLAKYKFEYEKGDAPTKQIIKSTILHMFADWEAPTETPYGLKQFLTEMRGY